MKDKNEENKKNAVKSISRKQKFFLLIFLLFCAFLFSGIFRLKVNENIYDVLPKGDKFHALNKILQNKKINDKVFFLLRVEDDEDPLPLIEKLAETINTQFNDELTPVTYQKKDLTDDIYNYYYKNFPFLIDSSYYQVISRKLLYDSIVNSIGATYRTLLSPEGALLSKYVLNDPVFISSDFFKSVQKQMSSNQMQLDDGIIYSKDKKSVFLYTNLLHNDNQKNEELYKKLIDFKEEWNRTHPENQIDFFGSFIIAVENALQVKKDTVLTISITILVIIFILLFYYRKLTIPFYFILPVVFGALFALGVIGYIKPEISGLSLATGAVLFGVMLDYSFHFFTHYEHTKSLVQTVKDIALPMLTGSITTILAFAILILANSTVLQDFGLFASLSLLGASLFTIFILPVILELFHFSFSEKNKIRAIKIPQLPQKYYAAVLVLIGVVTAVLFKFAQQVEFDSDLSHLSYHKQSLKEKEEKIVGINPDKQTKVYVFATSENYKQAVANNYQLFQKLKQLKQHHKIHSFISTGDFILPENIIATGGKTWQQFWTQNREKTLRVIDSLALIYGFNDNAFDTFKDWISQDYSHLSVHDTSLLKSLELDNLINNNNGEINILTTVIVDNDKLNDIRQYLSALEGVEIFVRKDMAEDLVTLVKDDFNYLLYTSAFIVFFTLLIVYGRIELTLLAFFPMLLSWVWILGFSAIFDIKFNFVNVIITTIIFGLGDDFSIFVTDGLLAKYKYRKNNLQSYQTAIILSALTTVIGTGVLYFAKHPAIHSIAVLSVLGIICIVLVSLFVQPIIFNYFIQNRVDNKKPPITLFNLLSSILIFLFFISGALFASLFLGVLLLIPLGKKKKRDVINWMLSKLALLNIYLPFYLKKEIINKHKLNYRNPSIIIANHSSFIDILVMIMLHPKTVIVVKEWVYKSPLFGKLIQNAGYLYIGDGQDTMLNKAKTLIADGYSIVIFPEGSRSENGKMKRFHKGAFYLSEQLQLDITPIIIHGASDILPKNSFIFNKGKVTLKVLDRIEYEDKSWGETYQERTKKISKYFKAEFFKLKNEVEDARYLKPVIFRNYIYKGPLLEWYFKIKWDLEADNFNEYNTLIGYRLNILDIGCGYGYFSYFLHYKNPNRKILGLDYDEEKIDIAKNGYNKTENLKFKVADIVNYSFESNTDAIFFNDVLHYLPQKEQVLVIEKAIQNLNHNGIIIIRDGVTDFENRHKITLKTEKYSTEILKFNKKIREFHFFSISFIQKIAEKHHLKFQMKEQSHKTSNVVFILTKK